MKILITTFGYIPDRSGVPAVAKYLAEGLAGKGHELHIATAFNGNNVPAIESINGVTVHRFNIWQNLFKKNKGDIVGYVDFVKRLSMDVLIMECLMCDTTDVLLPHLKELHCKIIIHAHGAPWINYRFFSIKDNLKHTIGNTYNWLRWRNYQVLFKEASKYINATLSCSICATDYVYFSKLIKNNYIIDNSADEMFFDVQKVDVDVWKKYNIRNKKYILNIATFDSRKNQAFLIESFYKSNLDNVSLVIAGTYKNEYYYKLVNIIKDLQSKKNIDIILLDESVKREELPCLLRNASLFCVSSKWEEYPITLVEAMACGTPFLSTMVGNAHILPGGITSRSEEEYPVLLRNLIMDQEYRDRLSQQGREFALKVNSREAVISKLEKILLIRNN